MQTKGRILFMDNEPDEVRDAVEFLQKSGYEVTTCETMQQAIETYYQQFYDIFILDIDMDENDDDGVEVLKRFQTLHNETRVIMYS
ncbi:MAG: DNA-binding NtrC family response regulator, partial [bacterium]